MSTSHDRQFGTPGSSSGAPAAIVWQDPSPGAEPAWTGPSAFAEDSGTSAAGAVGAVKEPERQSLSSAWASWSPAPAEAAPQAGDGSEGSHRESLHGGQRDADDDQHSPERGDEHPDPSQNRGHTEAANPDPVEAAGALGAAAAAGAATSGGWVRPGSAQTADEVHSDWTDRNGEQPGAPSEPSKPQGLDLAKPAPKDEPDFAATMHHPIDEPGEASADQAPGSQQQAHHGDPWQSHDAQAYRSGQQAHSDPWGEQQPSSSAEPWGEQAHGSYNQGRGYTQDAGQDDGQGRAQGHGFQAGAQDHAAAQDAWSAHHQGGGGQHPLATDPSAGEAIPAPPASDDSSRSAGGSPTQGASDAASDDDALTIGRGRDNSIVLDDMLVSRKHLRITADEEGLLLEDLGSRNGTYVNGRRVERSHLQEGDRIGVGGTTFEVRDGWLVTI